MNQNDKALKNSNWQDVRELATKITKEDLETYNFSKNEAQIILSGAHDALWHDAGKKAKSNGEFELIHILTSTQKRTQEEVERMNRHTAYGALSHLLNGLPMETLFVALRHHTPDIKRGRAKIIDDHSAIYKTVLTSVSDQLETGMAFRTYKFAKTIEEMRNDTRIIDQLTKFGDPILMLVYFQTLNILEQELGSDYPQAIREQAA